MTRPRLHHIDICQMCQTSTIIRAEICSLMGDEHLLFCRLCTTMLVNAALKGCGDGEAGRSVRDALVLP